jgi:exopolysaccharide production protein ExoF
MYVIFGMELRVGVMHGRPLLFTSCLLALAVLLPGSHPARAGAGVSTAAHDGGDGDAAAPTHDEAKYNASTLNSGDRIKLSFYEQLDEDEDKWTAGRGRPAPRGFHQRTELTGEYVVADDGTISLPLLGNFPAAGQSVQALQQSLVPPFEKLLGRKGFINALSVERQPVYIVGPVKNSGAFKYVPGMTILHAVALAGGLERGASEALQRVEIIREAEHLQQSLDRVKRLLARTAVLRAARDGGSPITPEIVEFAGKKDAKSLVAEEGSSRSLKTMTRLAQESALGTAVENARSEVEARAGRVGANDDTIKLRSERVRSLQQLFNLNDINRTPLIQAQSELSDTQERRQQALIEVESAKQRLAQAEQNLAKYKIDTRVEVDLEIGAAEQDGVEAVADADGVLNVMKTLAERASAAGDSTVSYEIVRRTRQETTVIAASDTSLLEPGDLVHVRAADAATRR